MPTNLKDVLKKKIIKHLGTVSGRKVLILDDATKTLLLDCQLAFHDISDLGYVGIEQIDQFRRPMPEIEAVYLVAPSQTSIKFVRIEFGTSPPLYAGGHVLMTSYVSDEMMEELGLALNGTFPLKRLDEINVQFNPVESQVFHLGLNDTLSETYGATSEEVLDDSISKVSDKILDVLLTLDDEIDIRYYDPSGKRVTLSSRLAMNLQDRISALRSVNSRTLPSMPQIPYTSSSHDWHRSSVLVIVDRSLDLLTPLLHNLSYQALMNDFYEIKQEIVDDKKHLVCDFDEELSAVFDESDEIFAKIRHQFLLDAKKTLDHERKEHLKRRNEARQHAKADDSYTQMKAGLQKVMNLVLNKDDIVKRGNQIAALIQINKSTEEIIESAGMERFFGLEQDLAVGQTADGEDLIEPFDELLELLDDQNEEILPRDKLRIFLIYLLTVGNIPKTKSEQLIRKAKFKENDAYVLCGLERLGVILDMQRDPTSPLSPFTIQHRRHLEPLPAAYLATHEGDRFIPAAFFVIRDIYACKPNTLRVFPSMVETLEADRIRASGQQAKKGRMTQITRYGGVGKIARLKHGRPRWGTKLLPKPETMDLETLRHNGPRLIFFVIGGISFPEIKVGYDLTKILQREVIVDDLFKLGGYKKDGTMEPLPDFTEVGDSAPVPEEAPQVRAPWELPLDVDAKAMGDAWFKAPPKTGLDKSQSEAYAGDTHHKRHPHQRPPSVMSDVGYITGDGVIHRMPTLASKSGAKLPARTASVRAMETDLGRRSPKVPSAANTATPRSLWDAPRSVWEEAEESETTVASNSGFTPAYGDLENGHKRKVFSSFGNMGDLDEETAKNWEERGEDLSSDEEIAAPLPTQEGGRIATFHRDADNDYDDESDDDSIDVPPDPDPEVMRRKHSQHSHHGSRLDNGIAPDPRSLTQPQLFDYEDVDYTNEERRASRARISAMHRFNASNTVYRVNGGDTLRSDQTEVHGTPASSITSWSITTSKRDPSQTTTTITHMGDMPDQNPPVLPPDQIIQFLEHHSPTLSPASSKIPQYPTITPSVRPQISTATEMAQYAASQKRPPTPPHQQRRTSPTTAALPRRSSILATERRSSLTSTNGWGDDYGRDRIYNSSPPLRRSSLLRSSTVSPTSTANAGIGQWPQPQRPAPQRLSSFTTAVTSIKESGGFDEEWERAMKEMSSPEKSESGEMPKIR
ncbi:Syntaxin-binding protein 3 [Phlyctochytrium planicorne]|nr:Syntaxin-binding protein 3 [Phlyctochytrium planicorne]